MDGNVRSTGLGVYAVFVFSVLYEVCTVVGLTKQKFQLGKK